MQKMIGFKESLLMGCGGVTVLALALAASPAAAADTPAPSTTTTTEHGGGTITKTDITHVTAVVTVIDKSAPQGDRQDARRREDRDPGAGRREGVRQAQGRRQGRRRLHGIDCACFHGAEGNQAERNARTRGNRPPGAAGREMTVTAEVIKVDPAANKITFKGPERQAPDHHRARSGSAGEATELEEGSGGHVPVHRGGGRGDSTVFVEVRQNARPRSCALYRRGARPAGHALVSLSGNCARRGAFRVLPRVVS